MGGQARESPHYSLFGQVLTGADGALCRRARRRSSSGGGNPARRECGQGHTARADGGLSVPYRGALEGAPDAASASAREGGRGLGKEWVQDASGRHL
jgi:hypothetical protein